MTIATARVLRRSAGTVAALALAAVIAGGCGREADVTDMILEAVGLRPAAHDVAPCRHRAPCQPENPCHLGEVTGCRANVPICSDTGAWRPDGTACGGDPAMVCGAGACTPCVDGSSCLPSDPPCRLGVIEGCAEGGACVDSGQPAPDGTSCGDGRFCSDGTCIDCPWWSACDAGVACQGGYVDCASGAAVCLPYYALPDGTPCPGGVCEWGACVPACVRGSPCVPADDPCATGQRTCDWRGDYCEPTGSAPDGTPCGDQLVCKAGTCSP